jgi:hypothetical protein
MRGFVRVTAQLVLLSPTLFTAIYSYLYRTQPLSQTSGRFLALLALTLLGILLSRYTAGLIADLIFKAQSDLSSMSKDPRVQTPPGTHLRAFALAVFSKRTFQLVIEPTLRDLFDEYCEALAQGRHLGAHWVLIRGYWSFWSAALAQFPISIAKLAVTVWKSVK